MQLSQEEIRVLYKALALSRDKLMNNPKYSKTIVWNLFSRLYDEASKQKEVKE